MIASWNNPSALIQDPVVFAFLAIMLVILLIAAGFLLGYVVGNRVSSSQNARPHQPKGYSPLEQQAVVHTPVAPELPPIRPSQFTNIQQPVSARAVFAPIEPLPESGPVPDVAWSESHGTPLVSERPGITATIGATVVDPGIRGTDATVRTRTGTNPLGMKLADPYEFAERVWTGEESQRALALYRSGKSMVPIAQAMQIDQRQVAIHLIRVLFRFDGDVNDLDAAPRNGWKYTDDDVAIMSSYSDAGASIQDISKALQRTVLGVGWRMLDQRML